MTSHHSRLRFITKTVFVSLFFLSCAMHLNAQVASSFELRYFSKEKEANGITDFKGEKEIFNTDQRVDFLKVYADVAGKWFMDTTLDKRVSSEAEVLRFVEGLKAKPLPIKRKRIQLEEWSKFGYKKNDHNLSKEKINFWLNKDEVIIEDGKLIFMEMNSRINRKIDDQNWRFHLNWKAKSKYGNVPFSLALKHNNTIVAEIGFHSNGNIFYTDNGYDRMGGAYRLEEWYNFNIEADLKNKRYNLIINGVKTGDWVALKGSASINNFEIRGGEGIALDYITGLGFDTTNCDTGHPYTIKPFISETFEPKAKLEGWNQASYDDSDWVHDLLPIVHGGAYEEGEDLYLRKTVRLGAFERAKLNIESMDPGGEIWVNGEVIFVSHEKHPVKIDITDFLHPYKDNLIAIRIYSFFNKGNLYHSPNDRNIGWFCGRAWLDLTEGSYIENVSVFTSSLGKNATQAHLIELVNDSDSSFNGELEIDYHLWYPNEHSKKTATKKVPVTIFARDSIHIRCNMQIDNPARWTHDHPNLYKIDVKLLHNGEIFDDEVITTGIRTVSQEEGTFRINGDPELLGGAQTMGFRMPIENIAKWNRCPPTKLLAEELLACKKLGNTLRIHVHAGGTYAYSVNDPRVAEMADQLGVMLIWPTTSWIREGEWGGIDFEGYPKYMKQVFNSPSIVMWEGANHPNRFKGKPLDYSNRFISLMYNTIVSADSSRLIAPSSYNGHFEYRNDEGTIDKKGEEITPAKEWTAPLIVRGNQDALTGYGAQWDNIRKWPDPYRKSFLDSKERAYINFEHEESIGMQNFSLAKGEPWYEMPSYENIYDVGSIGRKFEFSEWKISQGWQAFSAYESMKWQRILDIDGFSWCCLHGGPNSGTYRKPILDAYGNAKLGFYANQMVLRDVMPGSNNTDVVYGKKDLLTPIILNIGDERIVKLKIVVKRPDGTIVDTKEFNNVTLEKGRTCKELTPFKPNLQEEGYYVFEYYVLSR